MVYVCTIELNDVSHLIQQCCPASFDSQHRQDFHHVVGNGASCINHGVREDLKKIRAIGVDDHLRWAPGQAQVRCEGVSLAFSVVQLVDVLHTLQLQNIKKKLLKRLQVHDVRVWVICTVIALQARQGRLRHADAQNGHCGIVIIVHDVQRAVQIPQDCLLDVRECNGALSHGCHAQLHAQHPR